MPRRSAVHAGVPRRPSATPGRTRRGSFSARTHRPRARSGPRAGCLLGETGCKRSGHASRPPDGWLTAPRRRVRTAYARRAGEPYRRVVVRQSAAPSTTRRGRSERAQGRRGLQASRTGFAPRRRADGSGGRQGRRRSVVSRPRRHDGRDAVPVAAEAGNRGSRPGFRGLGPMTRTSIRSEIASTCAPS